MRIVILLNVRELQRNEKCIVTSWTTVLYRRTAFGQSKLSGDIQVSNPSEIGSEESVLALKDSAIALDERKYARHCLWKWKGGSKPLPPARYWHPYPSLFRHHSGLHSHDAF